MLISTLSSDFRAHVQGLRAIAVIGVILFHANKTFLPGGFVGVDVFFVISGFLIGGIVLQKKSEGRFSFVDFYFARARRIVPAYLAMLATVSLVAAIILTPPDFKHYWTSAKSALYFGSNYYYAAFGSYFAPAGHELPLLHTWSLAIEMQFYWALPLMLVLVPEKFHKLVIGLLIVALTMAGVAMINAGHSKAAYFSLWVRAPEFLVGVFLAALVRDKGWSNRINSLGRGKDVLSLLGLALIFYSFIAIDETSQFPGVLIAYPCIGAALVIATGDAGRVSSVLGSTPMLWIGSLSYSLYLWHWPVFAMTRYVTEQYEFGLSLLGILLFIVLGLAYASLRWIETPFRKQSVGLSRLRLSGLLIGIFSAVTASPSLNASVTQPLAITYTRYADPDTICHGRMVGDCLRGEKASGDRPVLVLGDSHAAQLNLFFDRVGEINSKSFRVISASSCVTIPGFDVERLPDWARKDCQSAIEFAARFIPESSNIVIAAMWQYQLQSKDFISALNKFLSQSQQTGKQVTLLWQVPMLDTNTQRAQRFDALGLRSTLRMHPEWAEANRMIAEIASHYSNVRFLEFSSEEIFKTPPFYRGELIYHDSHHLNELGAVKYAEVAAKRF